MRHEHPLELARIEAGQEPPLPDEEARRRREQKYIPIATVLSAVLLFGVYEFVTYEHTAITTLPQRATVVAFVPATPTLTPTPTQTPTPAPTAVATPSGPLVASVISHKIEGRENCLVCHGIGEDTIRPMPTDHVGRQNAVCLSCHREQTAAAPATPAVTAVSFKSDVLPLFEARCKVCHGTLGGLDLTSYAAVMKGGNSGPAIVAGQPEESLLVTKQRGTHPGKLADEELAMVAAWIKAGAPNN
jgi:mono/diheme cytochrome c family protein